MRNSPILTVKCDDVLRDNNRWYAQKARRKKIVLIRIEVTNSHSANVHVRFGATKLISGGKTFAAESPAVILRKLSEFTWDFLLYTLLDFHPVTAVFELCVFLTGPLHNRRLRRQLSPLTDQDVTLRPVESTTATVAFRGATQAQERILIAVRTGDTEHEAAVSLQAGPQPDAS